MQHTASKFCEAFWRSWRCILLVILQMTECNLEGSLFLQIVVIELSSSQQAVLHAIPLNAWKQTLSSRQLSIDVQA